MKSKTRRVALGGMLSAVALILMTFGSLITALDMTSAFAAGFAVVIAMIEYGMSASVCVYAVSGILAILLLPDKFTGASFLCYGGLYPIFKSICERIQNKKISFAVKFVISNIMLSALLYLGMYLITNEADEFSFPVWVYYIMGNIIFVAYDFALTLLIIRYMKIFKTRTKRK